jgi:tRNA (guanosine-2'-O-)-methyltransferase
VALQEEHNFEPNLRVTKGADTWVEVEKLPEIWSLFRRSKTEAIKWLRYR